MKKLILLFNVCLLCLASCSDDDSFDGGGTPSTNPDFVLNEQMLTIIKQTNSQIVSFGEFYALLEKQAASVSLQDHEATIEFTDGETHTLHCSPQAPKPFIGLCMEQGKMVWAVTGVEPFAPLKTQSGELVSADQAPQFAIDKNGYWAGRVGDQTLQITDSEGQPIVITGNESVALFRSVTADERQEKVIITLNSGIDLSLSLFVEKATDLSLDGTANCYLIGEEGLYQFSASVRGNGVGDQSKSGYEPTITLNEAMTADWVWMDQEALISDVKFDAKKGTITFLASQKKGNALIALLEGDNVVWSWHIWLTDAPQSMAYPSGIEFMDRNLGATSTQQGDTKAYGMYYQWGRKDPFYGGTTTETSAEGLLQARKSTLVNPKFESIVWSMEKRAASYDEAAAHPMTFYNEKTTNSQNWLKGKSNTLWGKEKTLNDPCPKGYKIPEISAWAGLDDGHRYIEGLSTWDGTLYGMRVDRNGMTHWWPAQGSRNSVAGNLIGLGSTRTGKYWSSDVAGAKACFFYFQKQLSSSSGSINPDLDEVRSMGYSVRCVKE